MSSRVLIVDEIATNRIVLKVKLANACYDPVPIGAAADVLASAMECRPDLILLDDAVQSMSWRRVAAQIRGQSSTANIPIILLTNHPNSQLRIDAYGMGINAVFSKPLDESLLMSRIRGMIRDKHQLDELLLKCETSSALGLETATPPHDLQGQVTLIATKNATSLTIQRQLQGLTNHKVIIQTRAAALSAPNINGSGPIRASDAYVVLPADNAMDGLLPCLKDLRVSSNTRLSSVLLFAPQDTNHANGTTVDPLLGFDLGASEVLLGDTNLTELAMLLNAHVTRKQLADGLRTRMQDGLNLALTDPLTGLHNRRYAKFHMARVEAEYRKSGKPFALMLLDLDHFKNVNDTYGHTAGDYVLIETSKRLKTALRRGDLISRFDGEEFLIILGDTNGKQARHMAERLRELIETHPVQLRNGAQIPVTVSIGMTLSSAINEQCDAMLEQADQALYASKADGRNVVTIATNLTAA